MKIFKYALRLTAICAVAQLFVACSNEEDVLKPSDNTRKTITIIACQPDYNGENATRVGFDGKGVGYWQAGDVIAVWSEKEKKWKPFAIASGAGEAKATFTGTVADETVTKVCYPYNERMNDASTARLYLPETYTYDGVDQSYSVVGGKSFNMPMCATLENKGEDKYNAVFSHTGGVLAVKVDRLPSASGTVTVTAKSNIWGCADATTDASAGKSVLSAPEGGTTVTFSYGNAEAFSPGVFYLPLAPTDYTLTVTVSGTGNSGTMEYTTGERAVTIARGHIKPLTVTSDYSKKIDEHKFIDLGLPSGLLWAETNVGASSSSEYGNYYAWGETVAYGGTKTWGAETTKKTFSWAEYRYAKESSENGGYSVTKYMSTEGLTLDGSDDAATANWGEHCYTPSWDDVVELRDKCTWKWTDKGLSLTGPNGNSIFVPAAGLYKDATNSTMGTYGCYWTRTLYTDETTYKKAYYLLFTSSGVTSGGTYYDRCCGFSVRPVAKP